ncbi:Hypothetical protein FKW44_024700, partial [Caligus rogercresseyi]
RNLSSHRESYLIAKNEYRAELRKTKRVLEDFCSKTEGSTDIARLIKIQKLMLTQL